MNSETQKIDISIVIPNYNSTYHLLNCLEAIYNQKPECLYEVVVVDSSEKNPIKEIHLNFPEVQVLHFNERMYPGTARNRGVEKAKGDIIAFTDADCIVSADWINKIFSAHQKNDNIVGGAIKNGYQKNWVATAEYFSEFGEFLPNRKPGVATILPSGNFTIKRKVFHHVGGFKGLITAEDVLFFNEVRKAGFEIYFDPEISITHFNRREISVYLLKQKELGIGSYFMRKRINVAGSWLTKRRIYSWLIPGLRSIAIVKKAVLNDKRLFGKIILVYPIILLGLISYSWGFWKAFKIKDTES